jgi:hypothetical protein
MDRKAMLPVNRDVIKTRMKEMGFTYLDIEALSGGQVTEHSLKHFSNKGMRADEKTIKCLAGILGCVMNDIVDKPYQLAENLPFETNKMVDNLYVRNKEDIMPIYSRKMDEFRSDADLKAMLDITHLLYNIFSRDDIYLNKEPVTRAYNRIIAALIESESICNIHFTGLANEASEILLMRFNKHIGKYTPQQGFLIFVYVFILFDAIFLEECISTTAQLMPQRKNEKADEYCNLTYRSETMRNTLLDMVLYKNKVFDNPDISISERDEVVLKGVITMLAACEKCYSHIKGPYTDSEYVNRSELSAILKTLENIFYELEIDLPAFDIVELTNTRFGRKYFEIKSFFNLFNPPKAPKHRYIEGMFDGLLIGKWR